MAKRFDVCSPRSRKDSDKTFWHRVGSAFENDKGINIVFDSLPLPDKEGRVSVFLFEPREKPAQASSTARRAATANDMDDNIPF